MPTPIEKFAEKMKGYNEAIDKGIQGVTGDVDELNRQIKALQDSAGSISASDQLILDSMEATGKAAAEKLTALDDLTPPPLPPG